MLGYVDIAGCSPAMGVKQVRGGKNTLFSSKMRHYHSPDGANGCCITSNKSLTCLQHNLFSRRIGAIFGMLSRRAGLPASAALSCYMNFHWSHVLGLYS